MSITDSSLGSMIDMIDSYNPKTWKRIEWCVNMSQNAHEDIQHSDRIRKELDQAKQELVESSGAQRDQMSNEEKKAKLRELRALVKTRTNEIYALVELRRREVKKELVL